MQRLGVCGSGCPWQQQKYGDWEQLSTEGSAGLARIIPSKATDRPGYGEEIKETLWHPWNFLLPLIRVRPYPEAKWPKVFPVTWP